MSDREAIARIIDPQAWEPAIASGLLPEQVEGTLRNRRQRAFAKADAILSYLKGDQ